MIFVILIVFTILRLPSLFEPHWYGDEGIYASVAYAIEQGKKLYLEVYDNRLPGIYYLYAMGESDWRLMWIRSLNILAGIITLICIYKIGNLLKMSKSIVVGLIVAVFFLGSPIWEGTIANTENFFIAFTAGAIYLALRDKRNGFIPGILFGVAFLFKFNPFFTFAGFGCYAVLINIKSIKNCAKYLFWYALGFSIPFILTCVFLFSQGTLGIGLQYALLNNTGYVTNYEQGGIPLSIRLLILICLAIASSFLYIKSKISRAAMLICLLFAFDTFSIFFSGRQYTHYLLQMILPISLLLSYGWQQIYAYPTRLRTWFITPIVIVCLIWLYTFYNTTGDVHNKVNLDPMIYYSSFYNGIRHTPQTLQSFAFFAESNQIQEAKYLHSILAHERHVFYTNESWIYDYLKINPPTIFVAVYHNYFIPYGIQRYIQDVEVYNPDSILVDKRTERQKEFNTYLYQHYRLSKEYNYFILYRKFR